MPLVLVAPYKRTAAAVAVAALFDQYFDYNSTLLDFEGTNGATTFTDILGGNVTRTGTATISSTRFKYGTTSARIPANSTVAVASSQDFNIGTGTGDFTLEGDFYFESIVPTSGGNYLFQLTGATDQLQIYIWGSTGVMPIYSTQAGQYAYTPTHSMVAGQWYHVALVRSGTTYTTYINGVQLATGTAPAAANEARSLTIGGSAFDGYVDNVRFTKGIARYTAPFTPKQASYGFSTQAYDPFFNSTVLQMHFNGANNGTVFTDVKGKTVTRVGTAVTSTTKSRFGTASLYFATKTDALTLPTSTDFDFVGDFTVEAWVNPSDQSLTEWGIYDGRTASMQNAPFVFALKLSGGSYRPYVYCASSSTVTGTTTTIPINTWTHVAMVRQAGVIKFYVNGVADATTLANAGTFIGGTNPVIGHKDRGLAGYGNLGYIDEVRITKHICRYNANFKPVRLPAADTPWPSVSTYDPYASNVKSLMRFEGANNGIVFTDEVSGRTFTRTGSNIFTSTTQKKYGSAALRSSLSNYLASDTSPDFNLGSGDFTVEMYVNFISMPSGQTNHDFIRFDGATKTYNPAFYMWGDGPLLVLRGAQTSGDMIITNHTMTTGVWYHLAFSRIGNTYMTFINGVLQGSYQNSTIIVDEDKKFVLGQMDGYIDELRITKGVCRYSGPFTPPTFSHPVLTTSMYETLYPSDPFLAQTILHVGFNQPGIVDSTGVTELKNRGRVTIDTNSYVENSGGYFNGASWLESNANSRFAFGTGDFTIEAWVKPTAFSGVSLIFESIQTGGSNNIGMYLNASGQLVASSQAAGFLSSTEAVQLNIWSHVVVQRSGTELSLWINGVKVKTVTNTTNFTEGIAKIGRNGSSSNYYTGWMDNVRLTKAARYTANFVPQIAI